MFSRFFKKARPSDQREHYRRAQGGKATLGVRLILPTGETVPGELMDVSAGGVAIKFEPSVVSILELESVYELRFTSLSRGSIKALASIRSGPRPNAPDRFGFQFVDQGDLFRQLDDSFYKYFNRRRWVRAQPALDRRVVANVAFGDQALELDVHNLSREGVSFIMPGDVAALLRADTSLVVKVPVPKSDAVVTFYGLVRHSSVTPQGLRVGVALEPFEADGSKKRLEKDLKQLEAYIGHRVEEMERYNSAFQ